MVILVIGGFWLVRGEIGGAANLISAAATLGLAGATFHVARTTESSIDAERVRLRDSLRPSLHLEGSRLFPNSSGRPESLKLHNVGPGSARDVRWQLQDRCTGKTIKDISLERTYIPILEGGKTVELFTPYIGTDYANDGCPVDNSCYQLIFSYSDVLGNYYRAVFESHGAAPDIVWGQRELQLEPGPPRLERPPQMGF
ncbi:MAG: hypothetical protein IRY83_10355 [Chloroflexi bacterium]|nr:hypothetical protein [Chloroflexota bacterium]